MDPLTALREYTIRSDLDKIVRIGDDFRFGSEYAFPVTVETAYRSKHVQSTRYTLETLVHFITNQHLKHTEYLQNARSLRIPAVTLPDRKPLLDYLTGKVASSDAIDFTSKVVAVAPIQNDLNVIPPEAAEMSYLDDSKKAEIVFNPMEWIRATERPLRDREQILVCKNRDFYGVLTSATKRDEERQRSEALQRKDNLVAKSRIERGGEELGLGFDGPKTKLHLKGSKIGEGVPIILVPSASSTLITIYNVKEFLEDGVFIPTDVKMKQMNGGETGLCDGAKEV